jgi:hypothetical protein
LATAPSLSFVADGYGNRRVVVFDKDGKLLRQWGRRGTPALSDPRGTVWDLEFSRDPQQKYL